MRWGSAKARELRRSVMTACFVKHLLYGTKYGTRLQNMTCTWHICCSVPACVFTDIVQDCSRTRSCAAGLHTSSRHVWRCLDPERQPHRLAAARGGGFCHCAALHTEARQWRIGKLCTVKKKRKWPVLVGNHPACKNWQRHLPFTSHFAAFTIVAKPGGTCLHYTVRSVNAVSFPQACHYDCSSCLSHLCCFVRCLHAVGSALP